MSDFMRDALRTSRSVLFLALALAVSAFACSEDLDVASSARAAEDPDASREAIVAMARLEPASELIEVGAAIDDLVLEVKVSEGDTVAEGDALVVLAGHGLRLAELEAAKIELERTQFAPLEVEAQHARVRSAQANLDYARSEVESQKSLSGKGFSAGKEFRDAELQVSQSRESLKEMRAELEQLEGGLALDQRTAENKVEQARQRLEQTIVRAPISGQVLRVPVNEGERVKGRPVVQLGDTSTMFAVAEVHANDVRLVSPGQKAVFSSPALPTDVSGVIDDVGQVIYNNAIGGEDPRAPKGLRVVRVRVRLGNSELARRLTNLEGQVRIDLRSTPVR